MTQLLTCVRLSLSDWLGCSPHCFAPLIQVDDFIDVIEGNRKYVKCLYVYNKIDMLSLPQLEEIARRCVQSTSESCWLAGRHFFGQIRYLDACFFKVWILQASRRAVRRAVRQGIMQWLSSADRRTEQNGTTPLLTRQLDFVGMLTLPAFLQEDIV